MKQTVDQDKADMGEDPADMWEDAKGANEPPKENKKRKRQVPAGSYVVEIKVKEKASPHPLSGYKTFQG